MPPHSVPRTLGATGRGPWRGEQGARHESGLHPLTWSPIFELSPKGGRKA